MEYNFDHRDPVLATLGLCEEAGELARAVVKMAEGIRGTPHEWKIEAAKELGDVIIKAAQVADFLGLDLHAEVWGRWDEIQRRDWKRDKVGHGLPRDS